MQFLSDNQLIDLRQRASIAITFQGQTQQADLSPWNVLTLWAIFSIDSDAIYQAAERLIGQGLAEGASLLEVHDFPHDIFSDGLSALQAIFFAAQAYFNSEEADRIAYQIRLLDYLLAHEYLSLSERYSLGLDSITLLEAADSFEAPPLYEFLVRKGLNAHSDLDRQTTFEVALALALTGRERQAADKLLENYGVSLDRQPDFFLNYSFTSSPFLYGPSVLNLAASSILKDGDVEETKRLILDLIARGARPTQMSNHGYTMLMETGWMITQVHQGSVSLPPDVSPEYMIERITALRTALESAEFKQGINTSPNQKIRQPLDSNSCEQQTF